MAGDIGNVRLFYEDLQTCRNIVSSLFDMGCFCCDFELPVVETEFMRLWSIHPKYLDSIGLVALWRESLLAQKVLHGKTKGYKSHPELIRFKAHPFPLKAISAYLTEIWKESSKRGYNFDRSKISLKYRTTRITVTPDELKSEFDWLCVKLKKRNPQKYKELLSVKKIESHPGLRVIRK